MVAQVQRRAVRELAAPVEHRVLLHVHGRAPVGQVPHGGLARPAQSDLDHRRARLRVSIGAAFTGYLSQQNFDSEWIGTQAKDGINSTGAGAFWNVLNFGQMLMWHIVLLPLVVAAIVGLHVLLVRRRGVVPPFAPTEAQLAKAGLSLGTTVETASLAPLGQAPVGALPTEPPVPPEPTEPPEPVVDAPGGGDRATGPAAPTAFRAAVGRALEPTGGPVMSVTTTSDAPRAHRSRHFRPDRDVVEWQGAYRRYDLAKEVFICFLVVLLLTVVCAVVFSSPDEHPGDREVLVERRAGGLRPDCDDRAGPNERARDLRAAVHAYAGHRPVPRPDLHRAVLRGQDPDQHRPGFRAEATCDAARTAPPSRPPSTSTKELPPTQQASWDAAYEKVVANATFSNGQLVVKSGPYGPVGVLISNLESMARTGALDGALLQRPSCTRPTTPTRSFSSRTVPISQTRQACVISRATNGE